MDAGQEAKKATNPEMQKDDLDAHDQGETDAEGRGGDHRPIQDNGTGGRTRNVAGDNTFRGDYPLPRDPHSPPGYHPDSNQAEVNDYGLDESVEVGTKDASVSGHGIEQAKAKPGGTDTLG